MSFSSNASTCLRCPAGKAGWVGGKLVCTQDGGETRLHAERGDCPLKLFSPSEREAWSAERPSRGLGDTFAKITSALGIQTCAGCKERQEDLNEKFPYGK